ncbi:MAG: ATPase, T2SS/T4P/T4SS family [Pseudomonadota bacterium]
MSVTAEKPDLKHAGLNGKKNAAQASPTADAGLQLLGDLLVARSLVTPKDVKQALAMQQEVGGLIGQALLRLGAVTEERLLETLSDQLAVPIADPLIMPVDPAAYLAGTKGLGLPVPWFVAHQTFVWIDQEFDDDGASSDRAEAQAGDNPQRITINVLSVDPLNLEVRETLDAVVRDIAVKGAVLPGPVATESENEDAAPAPRPVDVIGVEYFLASNQTIEMCLSRLQRQQSDSLSDDEFADTIRLREMAEEAPVIDFVNNIFAVALKDNASDIHIEAFEHAFVVRYRIDGVLHTKQNRSRSQFDAIASRIKLIAGMDIAERRLPQDGRHTIRFAGNDIDLRVSSVPSSWGESIVMRLLRKQTELPDLAGLGLMGRSKELLDDILKLPNGVFLVTGPTGSGKSTTLYRGLEQINDGYRKIITIEDPVEYDVDGITQIQVKPDIGYTFASGLRAILRQDPDVIMVGEIRDGETATIAAQASLTGHFVLSTLHTNSALAAITRLEDIGLERFLISASVRGLMAQRLVRRVCDQCCEEADAAEGEAMVAQVVGQGADLGVAAREPARWVKAKGCEVCDHTGYKGRIAIFEIAKIDDELREAIIDGLPQSKVFAIARRQGFLTLLEDGLLKARLGLTTLNEVHRVCGADAG